MKAIVQFVRGGTGSGQPVIAFAYDKVLRVESMVEHSGDIAIVYKTGDEESRSYFRVGEIVEISLTR